MTDEHTETLIAAKQRRLKKLELQEAHFESLTPPHISIELDDLRAEIANLQQQRMQLIFQARHLDVQPPPPTQGLILLVSPLRANEPLHTLSAYQADRLSSATAAPLLADCDRRLIRFRVYRQGACAAFS